MVGPHAAAIAALVDAFKAQRGDELSAQDVAEIGHLESVAVALDDRPADVSLLRELRITLGGFRKVGVENGASGSKTLAEFLASALSEAQNA